METTSFKWKSLLGLSVVLFLIYGIFNFVMAIAVPSMLHMHGSASMGGLVVGNHADSLVSGQNLETLRQTNRPLDDFFVAYMYTMCLMMMNFGILQIAVVWYALKRGQRWSVWALFLADITFIPYLIAIARIYGKYGVPSSEVLGSFGYFWVTLSIIIIVATVSGLKGTKKDLIQ